MKKNEPKLKDVRAPWDRAESMSWRTNLRRLLAFFTYIRRYGFYWAPASLDVWRYRRLLRDLDQACLRSLALHGALTAAELTDWLNREKLLRTKPERTGIVEISVLTVCDWVLLSSRRGLVMAWGEEADEASPTNGGHWTLTERGSEAVRSRFLVWASRLQLDSISTLLLLGGVVATAFDWLSLHQAFLILALYLIGFLLYVLLLQLWTSYVQKREGPGIAVVAIETLRSAGKPLPVLGASSR